MFFLFKLVSVGFVWLNSQKRDKLPTSLFFFSEHNETLVLVGDIYTKGLIEFRSDLLAGDFSLSADIVSGKSTF